MPLLIAPRRRAPTLAAALLALGALASCRRPLPPTPAAPPPAAVRLSVLSLNDLHGQLDPLELKTAETPPHTFRAGGAAALAATIAALRAQNPEGTLLLDAGDASHGSLLSNHFEGAPVLHLYRLLQVDASAIGNHEFDFGPQGPRSVARAGDDPRGALKAWARRAPYPLLSANVSDPAGAWPNVVPRALVVRRGVRVGLIGLTTLETPATTQVVNVKDLRFSALSAAARREAAALRRDGADVIIALAHLAGECSAPQEADGPGGDPAAYGRTEGATAAQQQTGADGCRGELFDLLRALPRGTLDAVVAGHSHRCIWRRFNGVLVSEACSRGIAVGRLELLVRPGKGVDHGASRALAPVPVCHDVFDDTGDCEGLLRQGPQRATLRTAPALTTYRAAAAAARRLVARYRKRIAPIERRVLARLERRITHARHGWSELGYLFAEVMRRAAGADVALINAGGIRADLPAGPVTFADLYAAFPFDNDLATVTLSGAQLEQLLRAALTPLDAGVMQPAGLRLRIRCGRSKQLVAVTREDGQPLVPTAQYRVALTDFMLAGDGLEQVLGSVPAARKHVFLERRVRDEIAEHLAKHGVSVLASDRPPPVTMEGPCDSQAPAAGPRPRHLCR